MLISLLCAQSAGGFVCRAMGKWEGASAQGLLAGHCACAMVLRDVHVGERLGGGARCRGLCHLVEGL